jgi:hypothetical protein
MALPEKYTDCRNDRHKPDRLEADISSGGNITVTATCELCDARLEYEVWSPQWDALYDDECDVCGEGLPWCECSEEDKAAAADPEP